MIHPRPAITVRNNRYVDSRSIYLRLRKVFFLLITLFFCIGAVAQPANNDCSKATEIAFGSDGFGLGKFTSAQSDLTKATTQTGEYFVQSFSTGGINKKTVWYKFSLPTTRAVRVTLSQNGSAIQAGNVGFAVFKTNQCLPGNPELATKFTPIETFGWTQHPCIDKGDYLIQVSSNNNANGPIYITLDVTDTTGAEYDKPKTAMKFGKVSANRMTVNTFHVECQSIENAGEVCLPNGSFKDFTKSTWHTFTTPDYFDYFSVWLGPSNMVYNYPRRVVGYRLYEGDVTAAAGTGGLTQIGGCDSLIGGYYGYDRKIYSCGQLKTNKVYTVQLLFHKDVIEDYKLALVWDGTGPTKGHNPVTTMPASNKLGVITSDNNGVSHNFSDQLACNARHSEHSCPKSMPEKGVIFNNTRYNLSTFFSFTLAKTTTLQIYATQSCSPYILLRVYKQSLTTDCTDLDPANLIATYQYNNTLPCLDPGNYVLQVMGSDSAVPATNFYTSNFYTGNYTQCLMSSLGQTVNVYMVAKTVNPSNKFSLAAEDKVDFINVSGGEMQPLKNNTSYTAKPDTFGCANTVLPAGIVCNYNNDTTKVIYREFSVKDSMSIIFSEATIPYSILYQGDANALATAQNKFSFPQRITGLKQWTNCMWYSNSGTSACVTPGTYTHATFGGPGFIGTASNIKYTTATYTTEHFTPATAQNMGSIWDTAMKKGSMTLYSDIDTFSCKDNGDMIKNLTTCNGYTKHIFRQFYLSKPSLINISAGIGYYYNYAGYLTLLNGKITDGVDKLSPVAGWSSCFKNGGVTDQCNPLPAGWYTIIASTYGPSYSDPLGKFNTQVSEVGFSNQITITLAEACPQPQFNRPYKASIDTNTKKPYLIEWGAQSNSTAAYPVTYQTYNLRTENFNCTPDTPFSKHPIKACSPDMKHVAYYVFTTTQESYLQIDTKGYWGTVFPFDVRKDSTKMTSEGLLQECLNKQGQIQICRLLPGTYTLAIFSESRTYCHNVTPSIYIDKVGYSRFDHAKNAYDFGVVKADSTWYNGKKGEVNPLNKDRAPSNDFFYCTTGAREKDPNTSACGSAVNDNIYLDKTNNVLHPDNATSPDWYTIDRRNLWYSFQIDKPGTVKVKVENKTPGKTYQYPFSIYKTDADGKLSFVELVSGGGVDSTLTQGLSFVKNNNYYYYCTGYNEVDFFVEPCSFVPTRYYIIVENNNPYPYANSYYMQPNHQVEVSVLVDSASVPRTKFDHYYQTSDMGTISPGTTKKGETDNLTCATGDLTDPQYAYNCQKTLWYKFKTSVTGVLNYRAVLNNTLKYSGDYYIQLFKEVIPGDSTNKGLKHRPSTSTNADNFGTQCIEPGTYYIMITGCGATTEDVYPEIRMEEQAGDFCSRPVVTTLTSISTKIVELSVDCHTIGTDYGEFNPTLSCPPGASTAKYKSSWYRIDVEGKDTLDVTVFINETTNAGSSEIKYRMMTGNCGAMQEQSCVQDALTKNTYKCLAPKTSYYIQVFTPEVNMYNQYVTGKIELNISSVKHVDTCLPGNVCIAVANFDTQFDCTKDKGVQFLNNSTYGSSIAYEWDFGYNNQKSNAVSPVFAYPALTVNKTYNARLVVKNTVCGKTDTAWQTITVPARPSVELGEDTSICTYGASIQLNATSHDGATYYWSNGSATPKATFSYSGKHWVEVKYKNCIARDTLDLFITPIEKKSLQTQALCNVDKVTLSAYRGRGEKYKWNTGATDYYIYTSTPGYYWVDILLDQCMIRDSFLVVSTDLHPLGNDTTICQSNLPWTIDATVSGATSYKWQDNSINPTFKVTKPGIYWLEIQLGGCTFTDTIKVAVDSFKTATVKANICAGQQYTLPSGKKWGTTGTIKDTLYNANGCASLITTLNLTVQEKNEVTLKVALCAGDKVTLPSGLVVNTARQVSDTVRYVSGCDSVITHLTTTLADLKRDSIVALICSGGSYTLLSGKKVSNAGIYSDTLKYAGGCDSLIQTVSLNVYLAGKTTVNASFCSGKSYTLPSGKPVTTAGKYVDTLRSILNGCDSAIITTNLILIPAIKKSINASICAGGTYILPAGRPVKAAGVYIDTIRTDLGCDSIINTVTLSIDDVTRKSNTQSICAGTKVTAPSGALFDKAGTYIDTVRNIRGCDSLISTITVTVVDVVRKNISTTICAGNLYILPSGKSVSKQNQYLDTLKYIAGCDSVIYTVELKVFDPVKENLQIAICTGNSYLLPSGKTVNTAGRHLDTLRNNLGCDSILYTIQLRLIPVTRKDINASICFGDTYTFPSGRKTNLAGNYSDTIRGAGGCDSIITTIKLLVETAERKSVTASVCMGTLYKLPSGFTITLPGTYLDTVKNTRGCDSLITTLVLSNKIATASSIQVTQCTGEIYTLPWGDTTTRSGVFRKTFVNAAGCDSTVTVTITRRAPLTVKISGTPIVCEGGTISLIATANGGMGAGYQYAWSVPGSDNNQVSFIPVAGKQQVMVSVSDGCTVVSAKDTIEIESVKNPVAGFTLNAKSGCAPFTAHFTNTSTATANSFNWNFGNALPQSADRNPTVTFNQPGQYPVRLTVKTASGCTSVFDDTIKVVAKPVIRISGPASICIGSSVNFRATATGNVEQWSWDFANGNHSDQQLPPTQQFNTAGTYHIILTGTAVGSCPDTAIFTLVVNPKPTVTLNTRDIKICRGQSTQLIAGGGVKYSWTPVRGLSDPSIANPVATPLTDVVYTVTVTSEEGCTDTDTVRVRVTQPFTIRATENKTICIGEQVTLRATGAVSYTWTPATGLSSINTAETIAKPEVTTTYTVTGYGTDQCFTSEQQVTITVIPLPEVELGRDTSVYSGDSFIINSKVSNDVVSYTWAPSNTLSCTNCPAPVASPISAITYKLTVANAQGCKASDDLRVSLACSDKDVFIPNTFTPNGDGANDIFYPRGKGIRSVKYLRIFNRWGELVFENKDFNIDDKKAGWDGVYKGQKLPSGVFVYSIQMVCDNGQRIDKSGSIMIVR
ncbi:PKD domain-containing protein [Pollutibacter soli]|uniref:PKD domain-containing protein n=1 Tax=Pollutibacter soli TaxID=3034157 RepID=UPI003013AAF5